MKRLRILHNHRYGITTYIVDTERGVSNLPGSYGGEPLDDEDTDFVELLEFLEIKYDPDREETIDIEDITDEPTKVWK